MDAILAFVSGKEVFVSLPTGYLFCYQLLFDTLQSHEVPTSIVVVVTPLAAIINERSSGGADLWNVNFHVFLINTHQKSVTRRRHAFDS